MRFTNVLRKQNFLAQPHLLFWVTSFHFFKKRSTKSLCIKYKKQVHTRIIYGMMQKYSCLGPHPRINELECQVHLHDPEKECTWSNFAPQASDKPHPSLGPVIVNIIVLFARGMELS